MISIRWGATLLLVAGCLGGLGPGEGAPATRTYTLSTPPAAHTVRGHLTIAVEELRADAPYDERRIVYRASRYRLAYYDDEWVAAPGVLIADALRRAYLRSGRFASVLSEPGTDTRAILGGRVVAFEEVDAGGRRSAHLAVELELRDGENGRALWTRTVEKQVPVARASRDALAASLSRAVAAVAAETAAEITAAVNSTISDAGPP